MSGPRLFCSFDLEIAKVVPKEAVDWKAHRPLGISCAALAVQERGETRTEVFPSIHFAGDRWPAEQVDDFCHVLLARARDGWTITGWNTLGFDFDVLAEECSPSMRADVIALALSEKHVDAMFHFFCLKGFPVGLDACCKGMDLEGKPPGMTGADAPVLWARNEGDDRERVLRYVEQDAREQLRLVRAVEDARGRLAWITKKGTKAEIEVGSGWLSVPEALALPEPDVSWMTDPWPRSKFTAWTSAAPAPGRIGAQKDLFRDPPAAAAPAD